MTGFVHKAYPPVYTQLARHAGFGSAMIVRGVEGGCIPSLSQVSRYFGYHGNGEMVLNKLTPSELGIYQEERMVPVPQGHQAVMESGSYADPWSIKPAVEYTLQSGLAALANQPGPALDSLIYGGAIALTHTGISNSLPEAAERVRQAIASGEARDRFEQG